MAERKGLPQAAQNGHGERPLFVAPNGKQPEGRRPHPIIDSLRTIQAAQGGFIEQGRGGKDQPAGVVVRMFMETKELLGAVEQDDRAGVASELADVILLTTRIAHHYGIPLDVAVSDKMARNATKYNPAEMEQLRAKGMGPDAIESHLKDRWDTRRDKTEFNRLTAVRAELAEMTQQDVT